MSKTNLTKVSPYPTKVKHFRKWRTNVLDDTPWSFLEVVKGKSRETGVMGVSVLRTKGKKTVTHGAIIPKGWVKRYHGNCRVELRQNLDGTYEIVRCLNG
jgi:hypothetical protein